MDHKIFSEMSKLMIQDMMVNESSVNGNGNGDFVPELPVPDTDEIKALNGHFLKTFDAKPDFIVRVPGRVNLIGEHIDYCGHSVCPMAIQQHILVAVRTTEELELHLTNLNEKFVDFNCDISNFHIKVDGTPKWYQYFLCGVRGALEKLGVTEPEVGLQAAVLGTIPPSAGLSSSSALVSAALLGSTRAFGLNLEKTELSDLAARCERYIGTQGGGMDQAIAFLATEGNAKLISFNPLSSRDIVLPDGAVFIVAHSLADMNKAATTDFNNRVIECRLASYVFAKRCNMLWQRYDTIKKLQDVLGLGVRHIRALVIETLHEQPYTKKEICYELCTTVEDLESKFMTENTRHFESFKLRQRMKHVTEEVTRVQEFERLCKACAEGKESRDGALWKLGKLMTASHESLRDSYECSHDDLDKIVAIALKHTLGARLTGAGWGGCTVAITTEEKADAYMKALKKEFYDNHPAASGKDLSNLVFATRPGGGAAIYLEKVDTN